MAMTNADLTARYIGEVITLVEFDIPGGPTLRYTPSSANNISFGGATYTPLDMSGSGFGATSGAFKDASLTVNNGEKVLMNWLNTKDDMKGTRVRFFQTLGKYLGNSSKIMNESFYLISQTSFNDKVVEFTLTHPLNQEGVHLPLRIMTRDQFPSLGKYKG